MRTLSTSNVEFSSQAAAQGAAFRYDAYKAERPDVLWDLQQALFAELTGTTFQLVFMDLAGAGDGHEFLAVFESYDDGVANVDATGFLDFNEATNLFSLAAPAACQAVSQANIAAQTIDNDEQIIGQTFAAGAPGGQRVCTMTLGETDLP